MKKNRSTLKDYFKKGAIPTEANFADLIDSMLNQDEDNISKLPNDPLKITAIGVDEALINFYRIEKNEEKLSWQVKQKPDGKSGLNISDTAASRLFIENGSGNVGIGTTTPGAQLDVSKAATGAMGGLLRISNTGRGANSQVALDFATYDPGGTAPSARILATDNNYSADIDFQTKNTGNNNNPLTTRLKITTNGNVGIGSTTAPGAKLQVVGAQDQVALRVGAGDATGNDFTLDVAAGQGLVNLVAGAKIKSDGKGYTFLGTRGASRINLHDGAINFYTSDATSGTVNADAVGLTMGSPKMILTNTGNVGIGVSPSENTKLAVNGNIQLSGNYDFTTQLGMLRMGTPSGSTTTTGKVVGAIGFSGFGIQHGQLSFRAGKGFELVDRTKDGPTLSYDYDAYPYADLKIKSLFATGSIGIGVAPTFKLHIKGSTSTDAELRLDPSKWSAVGDYGQISFGDANHYIRGEYAKGMKFYDTDKFTFDGAAVGIGSLQLKGFTTDDADEWPNVVWYRDTAASWDEGLIKGSSSRGKFNRAGFGIHMHQTRQFGLYSTGWDQLFAVEGGTGNTYVKGYLATKQVYFSAYVEVNEKRSGAQNPLAMKATSQNVGGAYSTSTSKFTAPVKGIYLFTMAALKSDDGDLDWILRVNDGYANSGGNSSDESTERGLMTMAGKDKHASRTIILSLNASDTVYIQQSGTGRVDNFRSGLEGILLFASM